MPHFFISTKNIENDLVIINDKENYQHIARSLRAKIGENIKLIDENRIRYEGKIKEITGNSINVIIEKATELGVKGVYPVYTDNCVVAKNVIEKKIPKWQRTMYEASKQCERADIPKCFELTTLENIINTKEFNRIIAFCERDYKLSMKEYLTENPIKPKEKILVIVGAEGGFTKREFDLFAKSDIIMLSLGDLILKAETAVIVGLGNIIYEFSNNK